MLYWLIVANQSLLDEIGYTPDIEGGIGPVKLGIPIKAKDGRLAVNHNWLEADKAWLESYLAEVQGALMQEDLPADFIPEDNEGV